MLMPTTDFAIRRRLPFSRLVIACAGTVGTRPAQLAPLPFEWPTASGTERGLRTSLRRRLTVPRAEPPTATRELACLSQERLPTEGAAPFDARDGSHQVCPAAGRSPR